MTKQDLDHPEAEAAQSPKKRKKFGKLHEVPTRLKMQGRAKDELRMLHYELLLLSQLFALVGTKQQAKFNLDTLEIPTLTVLNGTNTVFLVKVDQKTDKFICKDYSQKISELFVTTSNVRIAEQIVGKLYPFEGAHQDIRDIEFISRYGFDSQEIKLQNLSETIRFCRGNLEEVSRLLGIKKVALLIKIHRYLIPNTPGNKPWRFTN